MAKLAPKVPTPHAPVTVLFWFYKEPLVCRNHVELFVRTNPHTTIYGLYGGLPEDEEIFRETLSPYLSDFYTSPEADPMRKWRHGDVMIADWYRQRGQYLAWQSLFILQWDALVFTSIDELFRNREPDQLFFSGYKPITTDIEKYWHWTSSQQSLEKALYQQFQQSVQRQYPHATAAPNCWHMCIFVFEILTRKFLAQYATLPEPELGFLEYKIATYAHIWGYRMYTQPVGVYGELPDPSSELPVNALGREISDSCIRQNLHTPEGWRLFHPYFKEWKQSVLANE